MVTGHGDTAARPHPNLVQPDRFARTSSAPNRPGTAPHRTAPRVSMARAAAAARRARPPDAAWGARRSGGRGGGLLRRPLQRALVDCNGGRCGLLCYCP
ncbi:hypothetical protein PAHAL_2G318500 [Panicum hallii]|uniref:Uncharacterized protein n=1 Tax=Panicum hallii TaxID=206008 RepID=A0A2T8KR49_9POAL|nr:hypothetical protein PAHAL_2G318500 [Panicum hallii]